MIAWTPATDPRYGQPWHTHYGYRQYESGERMIFDANGKPVGNTLMVTPDWLFREFARTMASSLKYSRQFVTLFGPDNRPLMLPKSGVGDTVTIRTPERFK